MRKFELTITQADGKPYWTEGFDLKSDLNSWLKVEQSKPYWKKDFKVEVVDNTAELERLEKEVQAQAEAAAAAEKQKRVDARAAVKAFKDKPSKTVADVVKLLEVLVDILDLKPDETTKIK